MCQRPVFGAAFFFGLSVLLKGGEVRFANVRCLKAQLFCSALWRKRHKTSNNPRLNKSSLDRELEGLRSRLSLWGL
jgi:hypothetical protein